MSMNAKFIIKEQKCTLTKEALQNFLNDYPIPKKYKIMLPSKHQNIFDAPEGFVELYTHAFTLSNLRIPIHPLILEFIQYYKVHISRFNPFGLAKLTTYIVMCKAYGYEPSLNVLRGFMNLYPAGNWLTLATRGEAEVPPLLLKPFTNISYWKWSLFFIQDTIIPSDYPALLDEAYRFDKRRFNDELPYTVRRNPMYQRLARHPVNVQIFPEPILYMAGIVDRWEYSPQETEIICNGESMYIPISII